MALCQKIKRQNLKVTSMIYLPQLMHFKLPAPKEVGAIKTSAKAIADTIRYEIYKALENNDQRLSADLYTKRIVPDFDIISKATQYFSKVHIQGARDEILEMGKTAPIYIISTIQFALS